MSVGLCRKNRNNHNSISSHVYLLNAQSVWADGGTVLNGEEDNGGMSESLEFSITCALTNVFMRLCLYATFLH